MTKINLSKLPLDKVRKLSGIRTLGGGFDHLGDVASAELCLRSDSDFTEKFRRENGDHVVEVSTHDSKVVRAIFRR